VFFLRSLNVVRVFSTSFLCIWDSGHPIDGPGGIVFRLFVHLCMHTCVYPCSGEGIPGWLAVDFQFDYVYMRPVISQTV